MSRTNPSQRVSKLIRQILAEAPEPAGYINYGRVSSTKQRDHGHSLDGQCRDVDHWGQDLGLTQYASIQESHSGWKGTRPRFQREIIDCLPALYAAGVRYLVVYQLDRFARNVEYALNVLNQLTAHGIAVVSVIDTLDYTTADGWQTFVHRLTSAEYYSRKLSQTMQATRRREATQQQRIVGNLSTGFRRVPGGIEPDERADQQRALFDLFATDLYSCQQLAETMNRHGWQAWNEQKGLAVPYTKWNVMEMLRNPIYIGQVRYNGRLYPGHHTALIERDLWEQVQTILARRSVHRHRSSSRGSGPFTGFLHCECCNRLMWQHHRSGGYVIYECSGRYATPKCSAHDIRSDGVMQDMLGLCDRLVLSSEQKQRIMDRAQSLVPTPAPLVTPIIDQDARNRLIDLYTSNLIDKATFEERQRALYRAVDTAQASIPSSAPSFDYQRAFQLLDHLPSLLTAAPSAQQRAVLNSLFARIWATKSDGLIALQPQPPYVELMATAISPSACLVSREGIRFSQQAELPKVPVIWTDYKTPYTPSYTRV